MRFTILMASYNRLELLRGAVASALQQEFEDYELLIVDDGSDEQTMSWLERLSQQENVRVLRQEHAGVAVARANGVEAAVGEIIVILDSDDMLEPSALSIIDQAFIDTPGLTIAHCNIREQLFSGAVSDIHYPHYSSPEAMLLATLSRPRVPFKHSGTAFLKKKALALGSYDRALDVRIDIDFYLKFLKDGQMAFLIDKPLVTFLMHSNSVSSNRLAGLRVWYLLIRRYGPRNPIHRGIIITWRTLAELFKLIYVKWIPSKRG